MIKPDRHTNLDLSVLNLSSYILEQLNQFYDITYDDLVLKISEYFGDNVLENFPYALNFLYLLGKLEYLEKTDSFIYNATK